MEKTINVDFSDEEEVEEEFEELPEEDEMDDEFRAYIYSLTIKESDEDDAFFTDSTQKKKKRERKRKENNKKMLVLDFNQDFSDVGKTTEKTWKSKRLEKKTVDKKEYKFKPKMIPFDYRFKNETKLDNLYNFDNNEDFPSL